MFVVVTVREAYGKRFPCEVHQQQELVSPSNCVFGQTGIDVNYHSFIMLMGPVASTGPLTAAPICCNWQAVYTCVLLLNGIVKCIL